MLSRLSRVAPVGAAFGVLVLALAAAVPASAGSDPDTKEPELTLGELEARLARARGELSRLETADPPAAPGVLVEAKRRVELLVARAGAERLTEKRTACSAWKDREAETNEYLGDRLARLRERFADTSGASAGTPDLLNTNLEFVHEVRAFVEERLEPELRALLSEHLGIRAGIQDRLLQGSVPVGGEAPPAAEPDELRAALRAWYERSNTVVQVLLEIDGLYAARKAILDKMESFLLGYMYWVRSHDPLGPDTVEGVAFEIRRIVSAWVGEGVPRAAGREPWRFVLLAAGFLALVVGGAFLHRRLSAYHSRWNYRGGAIAVILQRIAATALVSSLAPVLLVLAALLLGLLALPPAIDLPVRMFVIGAAIVLFLRRFHDSAFREDGVAVTDMHAPPAVAEQLRRANRVVTNGLLLVAVPWLVLRTFPVSPRLEHLPRLLHMVLMVWVAFVLLGLLRRRGALVRETTGGHGFWSRVATVLGPLVVLATGVVLVMDAMGYRFGARLLSVSILQTFAAGIVIAGAYNLLTSLLDQTARRYRQKMRPEVGIVEADVLVEKYTRQVARAVGALTIVLTIGLLAGFWELGTGLRSVLSSLRITTVDEAAGTWLTGWDVLKSVSWIAGGHFLVANLGGILHVFLFSRMPRLQIGTRFAIDAIAKYAVLLVAYSAAVLSLHMSFSSLGWALAAVSFGVGFGLQEIVSNFVSGLILFFERPVRVGDVVSVGSTNGTIEKINIRATQILNLDHQVIILPNRKFISEEVVNWTHNDSVVRVTIDVGVAYGTDMVRAREVLFEIVAGHDLVKRRPEPRVWFRAFGESTLEVRVFVFTEYEHRLDVRNDLNVEIGRRFPEEGIEIAFPQVDLHLRTFEESGRLRPPPGSETST
ncbi:MAG: mechanosensitive ion channel domain-containing protein [Planctomycetota bacterium]